MREMMKLQQEQLNQLMQSISRLQVSQQHNRTPFRGPIICRRCQQPGHIARECGARVPTGTQPLPVSRPSRPFHSNQVSEN